MTALLAPPFTPEAFDAPANHPPPPAAVDTPLRWAYSSTFLADVQSVNALLTPLGHLLTATVVTMDGLTLPFVPLAAIPHPRL